MQFDRNRSRVVKFLGSWWFKQISNEEMRKQRDNLIQIRGGVHNEKQLADFMAKEQSIRDDFEGVQWRGFLIPDYSETESIFVFKVHHSVADGLALVMMFFNLTDEPDIKDFPSLTLRFALW